MPHAADNRPRSRRDTDYDLAALRRAVVADRPHLETLAALVDRVGSRKVYPAALLEKARARLAERPAVPSTPSAVDGFEPAAVGPSPSTRRSAYAKSGDPREDRSGR